MQHVRIATYEIKDGSFDELADIARKGMLPAFEGQLSESDVRDVIAYVRTLAHS